MEKVVVAAAAADDDRRGHAQREKSASVGGGEVTARPPSSSTAVTYGAWVTGVPQRMGRRAGGQAVQRQNCTVRARRSPVMFCCYCCATLERTVTRPDGYCQNHGVCDSPRAGCTSTAAATRVLSRERDFGARDRRQVSFWPVLRFVRVGNARKVSLRRDFSPNAINELIRRCTVAHLDPSKWKRDNIFFSHLLASDNDPMIIC